jgi:hypothetical protein
MRTSTGKRRMVATLRPADSFHYPARCGAAVGVLSRPQQMWCETPASSQPHGRYRPNTLRSMCLAPLI